MDLTGYDNNYWENEIQCMNLWKEMKKWLINDVIVIYYGYLINNWHEKYKKEVTINIYIDKETVKDEFKNEIIQILQEPPTHLIGKVKIIANTGLNSSDYQGIQLADIVANGLQRDYKETENFKLFRKVFAEISGADKIIPIAKTWRLSKKIN